MSWRRVALGLRGLAILVIAASAFAPANEEASDRRSVVFVVDDSPSTVALRERTTAYLKDAIAAQSAAGVEVGVVRFDDHARLVRAVGPGPVRSIDEADASDPASGSDLEGALALARGALPEIGARRVVLLSDGRATRGDAAREVGRLREAGVRVDVVPLGDAAGPAASAAQTMLRLDALEVVEDELRAGESAELRTVLRGPAGVNTYVAWSRDGEVLERRWVTVEDDGSTELTYVDREVPSGVHQYEVVLDPTGGRGYGYGGYGRYGYRRYRRPASTPADLTPRRNAILVGGKPRVLVVTLLGDQPTLLVDAIERADADVEHLQLTDAPLDEARLSGVDLVVLADLPLERAGEISLVGGLDQDAQKLLVRFVSNGGGLLATGGAFGFGPDWADTPLARILPVHVEDQGEVDDPPIALAVMLDRSGSMGARVGAHTKMELAVEASLASAATLRPTDRVAISTVDTRTVWTYPLGPVSEVGPHRDAIRRIRAGGGGIYVYTALVDAYAALREAPEPIRHVILFSDTADSEEQWQGCPFRPCRTTLPYAVDLARDARAAGLTTSVVGIGHAGDSDTEFLQELAAAGGGRFYLTTRGADLRRIFVTETRAAALSNLREEVTGVQRAGGGPMVAGLGEVPAVSGFVQSGPRATADLALRTPDGAPVLASWRYGLGTVVALTTDAGGRWTESWNDWAGAGQLMRQITRFAQRRRAESTGDARVTLDGERVQIDVELPDDAGTAPSTLEVFAYDDQGQARPIAAQLERVGLGRWRAVTHDGAIAGGPRRVLARARDARGRLVAEALGTQSTEREWSRPGADIKGLEALARVGGGVYDPGADVVPAPEGGRPRPVPTWPWWLLAAAILVVLDLLARRLEKRPTGRPVRLGEGVLGARAASPVAEATEEDTSARAA